MTEAPPQVNRPNIWERMKTSVSSGWEKFTGALGRGRDRVQDFAVEARAFVGAGVQGIRDRAEAVIGEVKGDFDGGVKQTLRNLGETVSVAGKSLWERVKTIGERVKDKVEGVKTRCQELGVGPGLVSKFRDGIDRVRQLPADISVLRAQKEDEKIAAMDKTAVALNPDNEEEYEVLRRFSRVYPQMNERCTQLQNRAQKLYQRVETARKAKHDLENERADARKVKKLADEASKAKYKAATTLSAA
ncbi:MAG: hypothetical protein WCT01_00795 [Candidatus Shapirobacteria bacterium]|jgi:hypothetical protein